MSARGRGAFPASRDGAWSPSKRQRSAGDIVGQTNSLTRSGSRARSRSVAAAVGAWWGLPRTTCSGPTGPWELVDWARRGTVGGLMLLGEPGVGKTALIRDFVSTHVATREVSPKGPRHGWRAIRAALGVRLVASAAASPGAARPGTGTPRGALTVPFGDEEGAPVDPFLVDMATLSR
jgi:hypothetical protein